MHRNALFRAVHNFSIFFHVFVQNLFFPSLSMMDINDCKPTAKTPVYFCKPFIYGQCRRTLTLHCDITFLNKSHAKLNE